MFARIAMFGLALFGLWLVWRAVRRWQTESAAARENAERERLPHQRNDGSAPWIAAVGSADGTRSGSRKSEHHREPDAARDVDAHRIDDHRSVADSQPDGGSGGGDSGAVAAATEAAGQQVARPPQDC